MPKACLQRFRGRLETLNRLSTFLRWLKVGALLWLMKVSPLEVAVL